MHELSRGQAPRWRDRTYRQTDGGDDNTRGPKVASCKNTKLFHDVKKNDINLINITHITNTTRLSVFWKIFEKLCDYYSKMIFAQKLIRFSQEVSHSTELAAIKIIHIKTRFVNHDGANYRTLSITTGVPSGSILDPSLFIRISQLHPPLLINEHKHPFGIMNPKFQCFFRLCPSVNLFNFSE